MWENISPSFRDDRIGWNRVYEADLAKLYGNEITIKKGLNDMPDILGARLSHFVNDDLAQNIFALKKQLCLMQRDLSRKVAQRYAEDDFVEQWTEKCTESERKKWLLEGLVRTCKASPDFEGHRKWAPETTMTRLLFQYGKGFLRLMEGLILSGFETVPTDFRTVPNDVFDTMNKNGRKDKLDKKTQLVQLSHNVSRTFFLTMFCWNTLLAFYGESETYGLALAGKANKKALKETLADSEDPILRNAYREARKAERLNKGRGVPHCTSCDLPADRAGVPSLQACQRCKTIGRSVYYCSKACQVNDWKNGHPPHKKLCGKADGILDALTSATEEPSKAQSSGENEWGPVQEGFVRSPALLHQLKLIEEHDHQLDYFIVRPYPEPDQGIILKHAMGKMMFQIMFQRAIREPAPLEVLKMYELLEPTAAGFEGYGQAGLKKQMKKEFGYDVDDLKKMRNSHKTLDIEAHEIEQVMAKLRAG